MLIQYLYAMLTTLPCPIWFWYRWGSAGFLCTVFTWSIYNGATYYIDIFGRRFEKELEQLKKDVQRMQSSPEGMGMKTPLMTPDDSRDKGLEMTTGRGHTRSKSDESESGLSDGMAKNRDSVPNFPLLDESARDVVADTKADVQTLQAGLEMKKYK